MTLADFMRIAQEPRKLPIIGTSSRNISFGCTISSLSYPLSATTVVIAAC